MFSLALKNAILLVLIILILHVLLKNMMVDRPQPEHFEPPVQTQTVQSVFNLPPPEAPSQSQGQDDENELYKFVYGEKPTAPVTLDVQPLGNFSKFCDYASV
jgi:hypothetical protein